MTYICFFFFQAEDGIRDHCVTGVQTCALPIYFVAIGSLAAGAAKRVGFAVRRGIAFLHPAIMALAQKLSFASKESGADGNSSFRKARTSFRKRGLQHRFVLFPVFRCVRIHWWSLSPFGAPSFRLAG